MLKLGIMEIFARGIPEGFLFILAAFTFSKTKIQVKKFVSASIIYAILVYLIRLLPIQFGVNTVLTLMTLILVTVGYLKIDIIKSIQVGIITIIIEFICEGINVFMIQNIFKSNMQYVFSRPDLKILYGIPSLLIFVFILGIYYAILAKRKELKGVSNGEDNE